MFIFFYRLGVRADKFIYMNIFGFNTIEAVLGLFTFLSGGIFVGFLLIFVKFVMFGFLDVDNSSKREGGDKYDYI